MVGDWSGLSGGPFTEFVANSCVGQGFLGT